MAIKGFQRTRTKPQNLREIVQSQDGFLGGLNTDLPKSDVGDTQLPVLKNCLPFRDRVEARGGLKPQAGYLEKSSTDNATLFNKVPRATYYDGDWDEIFTSDGSAVSSAIYNFGKIDFGITYCHTYNIGFPVIEDLERKGDKVVLSATGKFATIEKRDADYFIRPTVSDSGYVGDININNTLSGAQAIYLFQVSFVRIVDDIVVAESAIQASRKIGITGPLDDVIAPFSLTNTALYPDEYFDVGYTGTENFYTHVRYYRSEEYRPSSLLGTLDLPNYSIACYHVGDYALNSIPSLPAGSGGPTLDLNVSDALLASDASRATIWQSGYQPIEAPKMFAVSSGMMVARSESKKNEFVYCPIGAGDNEKYFGWYNPLFQYGSVDGDITQILDMGSYVAITTNAKTYYLDTVNFSEDEGQRAAGVFTPILPSTTLISDRVGVLETQRRAFIRTSIGSAIAFTSDGEIRTLTGYQWGADLSQSKVHSITKGKIKNEGYPCSAEFVNDTYYLAYNKALGTGFVELNTLRLGTTEEAGNGFSEVTGEDSEGNILGWPRYSNNFPFNFPDVMFLNINGILNVIRPQYDGTTSVFPSALMEYTGDKFDKKLNKDVVDVYDGFKVYQSTEYYDIPAEIEFPETTGSQEAYFLYFLKANFYLRSDRYAYKVANEATKGYEITDTIGTAVGEIASTSLSDIEFGMDVSIGEDEGVYASNEDFEPTSAVTIQRDVQDHRIRVKLRADSAGFQLTGMDAHFKRHDRTEMLPTETTGNVLALSTGMYCHVNEKLNNLSAGTTRASTFDVGAPIEGAMIAASQAPVIIGTEITKTTGPDGSQSGLVLASDTIYEWQVKSVEAPTKASVMYWENAFTGKVVTGWNRSQINMYEFVGRSTGAWSHTAHVHDGTNWLVYYEGVLQSTTAATLESYIKSMGIRLYGAGQVSDVRMYNKELTASDLALYIDNITNNEGDYLNGYV